MHKGCAKQHPELTSHTQGTCQLALRTNYSPGIKVRRITDFAVSAFRCRIGDLGGCKIEKYPISHIFDHCGDSQFDRFGLLPISP